MNSKTIHHKKFEGMNEHTSKDWTRQILNECHLKLSRKTEHKQLMLNHHRTFQLYYCDTVFAGLKIMKFETHRDKTIYRKQIESKAVRKGDLHRNSIAFAIKCRKSRLLEIISVNLNKKNYKRKNKCLQHVCVCLWMEYSFMESVSNRKFILV